MTYVISDIHGCYEQYKKMLRKIEFSDDDTLYVLGDVIDRGDESIKVLQDMSMRANVYPIMGNHEYIGYLVLKDVLKLMVEITDESIEALHSVLDKEKIDPMEIAQSIENWKNEYDSVSTLEEFRELPAEEREYLLEYLEEFALYEIVDIEGKQFFLTHFGIPKGAKLSNLNDYDGYDFVEAEFDYNKTYFKDMTIITGHLPTLFIDENYKGKIYRKNNIINIDTGVAFGGNLACLCLDTDEEFYV